MLPEEANIDSIDASEIGARLRIHHWIPNLTDVLGPGRRAVVWVQGCPLKCPGCMVPETWSPQGGEWVNTDTLSAEMLADAQEGITVSGGEPTEQPLAVTRLLEAAHRAGKNTWVYSGYTLEELISRNQPEIDAMLTQIDVLVDGRFDQTQSGTFQWRGSSNQRILHLTDAIPPGDAVQKGVCRVEIRLTNRGEILVVGIPPPEFLKKLKDSLQSQGLTLANDLYWH